jgi:hypothetical protein
MIAAATATAGQAGRVGEEGDVIEAVVADKPVY